MYRLALAGIGLLGLNEAVKQTMLIEDTEVLKPSSKVSIVVPSYNEGKYIGLALDSIFSQSIIKQYPGLVEVIVVDGRSIDNTVEIAMKYPVRMVFEPKKGKLSARNTGIDNAQGDIIVAADSDRIYQKTWLNSLLKPFNDPNVVATCGSSIWAHEGLHQLIQPLGYSMLSILYPTRLDGGNSSFRKSAYYQVDRFDESINQTEFMSVVMEEEVGFGERLSKYGKVIYQINATDYHLGSNKLGCRTNENSSQECTLLKIHSDRM